jgi:hypothetical protein
MAAPADLAGDEIVPHHAPLGNILGFLETPTEEKYHAYFYKKKKTPWMRSNSLLLNQSYITRIRFQLSFTQRYGRGGACFQMEIGYHHSNIISTTTHGITGSYH